MNSNTRAVYLILFGTFITSAIIFLVIIESSETWKWIPVTAFGLASIFCFVKGIKR